jgi:hypothetical protein
MYRRMTAAHMLVVVFAPAMAITVFTSSSAGGFFAAYSEAIAVGGAVPKNRACANLPRILAVKPAYANLRSI